MKTKYVFLKYKNPNKFCLDTSYSVVRENEYYLQYSKGKMLGMIQINGKFFTIPDVVTIEDIWSLHKITI